MPIETLADSDLKYFLVCYDKHGVERSDDPDGIDGVLSRRIHDVLANESITDVFFVSHGWQGDIPAAKKQCDNWMGAMLSHEADIAKMHSVRPGFKPLLIGLHWPSLPWGNEEMETDDSDFSFSAGAEDPIDAWIDSAADKIADTPKARAALRTIFEASEVDLTPSELSPEVVEAYTILQKEAELDGEGPSEGPGAEPGADRENVDPQALYQQALEDESMSFGLISSITDGMLAGLRSFSFWTMKQRACDIGQTGVANLLRGLQRTAETREVRFHLMGHSFGCILCSAAIAGTADGEPLVKPVDTVFFAQGALSLWSYCSSIPHAEDQAGYFHSIIRDKRIAGPMVTTQSEHDTAVVKIYPLGVMLRRQFSFAPGELPKYGGVGAFGAQGPGIDIEERDMLAEDAVYNFEKGKIYNLESSQYICEMDGAQGAHSDIDKPQVAHAFWEAIMTA